MKRHFVFAVVALAMTAIEADAKGCIKGAVVGGIAGHAAGHHAVIGAVSGCIIGHHLAKKHEEAAKRFLAQHRGKLAARVVREVQNKIMRQRDGQ